MVFLFMLFYMWLLLLSLLLFYVVFCFCVIFGIVLQFLFFRSCFVIAVVFVVVSIVVLKFSFLLSTTTCHLFLVGGGGVIDFTDLLRSFVLSFCGKSNDLGPMSIAVRVDVHG